MRCQCACTAASGRGGPAPRSPGSRRPAAPALAPVAATGSDARSLLATIVATRTFWADQFAPKAPRRAPGSRLEWVADITPGDDRLRRGRSVGVVASRGPGRPRKTPGKPIRANSDTHEFALAA